MVEVLKVCIKRSHAHTVILSAPAAGHSQPMPLLETPRHSWASLGQSLGGLKQNLVWTMTQKKGAVTPQEIDPDLPVTVQESPGEEWVGGGLLQGWGH